ncbi:hypothetical protein AJ78_04479 [Emergomyces pasteurianus Ep9510]|uniref:Uncharacterized protein n=1 Tax=Emergomyces pasteurianus Ep9510 TaxID=1447872 RepID=A0A1J9PFN7_9EURO|nr:hypothetical protein AJ78_04479 [Emergomyces pasteurianus Ep9510]
MHVASLRIVNQNTTQYCTVKYLWITALSVTANKSPAQDKTSVNEDSKLHDEDLLKVYSHLNRSLVAELHSKLAKKEWADLTQVVTRWGRRYPSKRRQLENLYSKKGSSEHHGNAMTAAISRQRAEIFSVSPDEPIIHRPLAPEGKVFWERFLLAVIQLSEQVVVKASIDLPLSHFNVIDHIWKVSHDIPAPRPLEAMSIGKRTHWRIRRQNLFMATAQGSFTIYININNPPTMSRRQDFQPGCNAVLSMKASQLSWWELEMRQI